MINRQQTHRSVATGHSRHGVVLVAVIVTMTIGVALFAVWMKTIVREQRQLVTQHLRLQAVRLAEDGIERAMARRAADPNYEKETWSLPADILGGRHAAEVHLRVTSNDSAAATHFEAIAEYPVGAVRRVQITKRIEIPNPTGEES